MAMPVGITAILFLILYFSKASFTLPVGAIIASTCSSRSLDIIATSLSPMVLDGIT